MTAKIGIAGTGSHMPSTVITNDELAKLIARGDKGADWAQSKLGIKERRFMTRLDSHGKPVSEADELDMAEAAARKAIANAGIGTDEVDGIYFISCTQKGPKEVPTSRQHFSKSVLELHERYEQYLIQEFLLMDIALDNCI